MYGFNYSTTMPELAGKSLTLSYVPATAYDEWLIEYYGGIFNVPAYLVHMKPQLKVKGSVVAEGYGVTLGTYQVFRSDFLRPLGTYWDTNDKRVTTGADYSVSMDQQRVSLDLVNKRVDYLKGLIDGLPPESPVTQEMIEEPHPSIFPWILFCKNYPREKMDCLEVSSHSCRINCVAKWGWLYRPLPYFLASWLTMFGAG